MKALQQAGVGCSCFRAIVPPPLRSWLRRRVLRIGRAIVRRKTSSMPCAAWAAKATAAPWWGWAQRWACAAGAHVSFAFGRAVPLAQARADFVVLGDDLSLVPQAIVLARRTLRVVRQNLWWAAGYNALCVPLAIAGYMPAGWPDWAWRSVRCLSFSMQRA